MTVKFTGIALEGGGADVKVPFKAAQKKNASHALKNRYFTTEIQNQQDGHKIQNYSKLFKAYLRQNFGKFISFFWNKRARSTDPYGILANIFI